MTKDKDGSVLGNLVVVIITFGFLIGSIQWTQIALRPVVKSIEARGWVETPAVIQSSMLDQPHRRQYQIKARYSYDWDATALNGTAVFFDEFVGVRKSYYAEINRTLLAHRSQENPIAIWVNPDDPTEAVIYRHIRWDKLGGNLILAGVWWIITAVLVGALWAVWRSGDEEPPLGDR